MPIAEEVDSSRETYHPHTLLHDRFWLRSTVVSTCIFIKPPCRREHRNLPLLIPQILSLLALTFIFYHQLCLDLLSSVNHLPNPLVAQVIVGFGHNVG